MVVLQTVVNCRDMEDTYSALMIYATQLTVWMLFRQHYLDPPSDVVEKPVILSTLSDTPRIHDDQEVCVAGFLICLFTEVRLLWMLQLRCTLNLNFGGFSFDIVGSKKNDK